MERLTEEKQIGPFAALKDKAESVPGAFATYECLYAHMVAVTRLKKYEDTGLEPEQAMLISNVLREVGETYNCWFDYVVNCVVENSHLKDIAKAKQDGRMVVLPVPVGKDKMAYGLTDPDMGPQRIVLIECGRLDSLEIWDNQSNEIVVEVDGWEIGQSDIGKTVFLTREEAEAALKKKEEADNEAD